MELTDAEFSSVRSAYRAVLLDVGTGDGKHALHVARQRPDWMVVGLDANRDNMRRASARAAAKPAKGGLPNLIFVWSAAEQLPGALAGVASLHALMPWGSLLRGLLALDKNLLRMLSGVCLPGAEFLVTLNLHAWRPPVPEVAGTPEPAPQWAQEALAPQYSAAGWQLADARYLSNDEVAEMATSWTRRLGSSRDQFDVLALTGIMKKATDALSPAVTASGHPTAPPSGHKYRCA